MKDEYICYRTQCRYHSGDVSGRRESCQYFFITGMTKTSQGEADITRKCGLFRKGQNRRAPAPIALPNSPVRKKKAAERKETELRRRTGGKKYDWGQFEALWKEGKPDTEIARAVGCYPDTVRRWRKAAGLPPRYRQEIDRKKLKELWEAGMDDPHIAKELGVSTMSAWRARNGMGLPTQKERAKE